MEKECNVHSCCRAYQKYWIALFRGEKSRKHSEYTIFSFNASDLFLALLTESSLCCLALSSKIYLNYPWVFERQKLCFFSVIIFLFRNVRAAKRGSVLQLFLCCVHLTHSGLMGVFLLFHKELVEAMLSFTSWWACFSSFKTNLCDLSSSFEICLENLLAFIRRMNKKLLVFKSQSYLVYFFPVLLSKWGVLSMVNLWKFG